MLSGKEDGWWTEITLYTPWTYTKVYSRSRLTRTSSSIWINYSNLSSSSWHYIGSHWIDHWEPYKQVSKIFTPFDLHGTDPSPGWTNILVGWVATDYHHERVNCWQMAVVGKIRHLAPGGVFVQPTSTIFAYGISSPLSCQTAHKVFSVWTRSGFWIKQTGAVFHCDFYTYEYRLGAKCGPKWMEDWTSISSVLLCWS